MLKDLMASWTKKPTHNQLTESIETIKTSLPDLRLPVEDIPILPIFLQKICKSEQFADFAMELMKANPDHAMLATVAFNNKMPRVIRYFSSTLLQKVNK